MRLASFRVLPATILVTAALLGLKTLELVRAATPAAALGGIPAAAAPASATTPTPPAPVRGATPPVSASEKALLQDLRQRRLALDKREHALEARESVLTAAEHKVDQRVAELQALQQRLEAMNTARKQREDASWQGLVKVYGDMKPRDAAKIFDDLDMSVLLQVVDRMNERKAAAIFAAMQPDRARDVTARLAAMRLKQDGGS